jgi:hypothetical protein
LAHFAKIDENNVVTQVIVVDNKDTADASGIEKEHIGAAFCERLLGGTWKQTSAKITPALVTRLMQRVTLLFRQSQRQMQRLTKQLANGLFPTKVRTRLEHKPWMLMLALKTWRLNCQLMRRSAPSVTQASMQDLNA